ncbi:MAG: efflux RND transporter periplasmic adaptor subunit [Spirochaeta sp.]|jgi:RND family efflux transporter MFP subunit|nr:efflux RND transporter periplasmic adaptor subunit [Spirochaeta sp.]
MKQISRRSYRAILLGATFAVIATLGACSGSGDQETAGNSAGAGAGDPVAVRVQQPEYRTLEHRISYVGTVFARQEVPIIARVQGTLSELPVPEGASFTKGTVLARLESPEMEAAVERLHAEVDYWSARHETDTSLVEQGALAPEQAHASNRALRTARAGLAEAEAQLAKTVVTAPFDGTVLDWPAETGQPVMPGQPLILIGDATREIRVDVVEEDLSRGVTVGTSVELAPAPDRIIASRVTSVAPAASGRARTFSVTVPIPAVDTDLPSDLARKGASIRTDFIVERRESALAVPVRALADRDGSPHLFTVVDEVAHRHDVTAGITQGGWIAVSFDWNGTDPVAVTNLNGLRDGAPVYAVSTAGGN